MANDIVNGGAIILVAAVFLAAIVGGADEFRALAGPASSQAEPNAASGGQEDQSSGDPDVRTLLGKHRVGDDRDDKRGDRDRDDGRHHDEDDEGGDDEDEEDDD